MTAIDLTVRLAFADAGPVELAADGLLRFPVLRSTPGVYRLEFRGADGFRVYLGESDNVRRRSTNYRRPTYNQATSKRINAELHQHLAAGGTVTLALATTAEVVTDGTSSALDLRTKAGRVLAEHAALVAAVLDGESVLNR